MRDLVIQIDEPVDASYPVRLYSVNDGGSVVEPALFEDALPSDWAGLDPPMDPDADCALTPATLRLLALGSRDGRGKLEEVGQFLHRILLGGDAGKAWERAVKSSGPDPVRTFLDIRPPSLGSLPWELMCDPPYRIFMREESPFLRGRPGTSLTIETGANPLRVLVIIGCEASDKAVEWKDETLRIKETVRLWRHAIDCTILERPSPDDLAAALSSIEPDVLHFIGHGRPPLDGREASLEFHVDEDDTVWDWTVSRIVIDLNAHVPRLVVLNACHSAESDVHDSAWSVARAFSACSTPAIISMQGAIPGKAAAVFGAELYRGLAQGEPLDVILARARRQVSRSSGLDLHDWSLATLIVNASSPHVAASPLKLSEEQLLEIRQIKEIADIKGFVDRNEQRREVWDRFMVDGPERSHNLLLITGDSLTGKTAMTAWCLEGHLARGHQAVYRNFTSVGKQNFLDVLRIIRDGDPTSESLLQRRIEPGTAFYRFNQVVNALTRGENPPARTNPVPATADEMSPLKEGGHEQTIAQIFSEFLSALREAAGERPLVIALDHVSDDGIHEDHFRKYLLPRFIGAVAEGVSDADIRLILSVARRDGTSSPFQRLQLQQVVPDAVALRLEAFATADYERNVTDYLHAYLESDEKIQQARGLLYPKDSTWTAEVFTALSHVVKLISP